MFYVLSQVVPESQCFKLPALPQAGRRLGGQRASRGPPPLWAHGQPRPPVIILVAAAFPLKAPFQ